MIISIIFGAQHICLQVTVSSCCYTDVSAVTECHPLIAGQSLSQGSKLKPTEDENNSNEVKAAQIESDTMSSVRHPLEEMHWCLSGGSCTVS